jgi:predicted RNA-binding protein
MPQTRTKPFHKSKELKETAKLLQRVLKEHANKVHICFYAFPFGVTPIELDEVYPLSQYEAVLPPDKEAIEYVANQVEGYVSRTNYEAVALLNDSESWGNVILKACRKACLKKNIKFKCFNVKEKRSEAMLKSIEKLLQQTPSE